MMFGSNQLKLRLRQLIFESSILLTDYQQSAARGTDEAILNISSTSRGAYQRCLSDLNSLAEQLDSSSDPSTLDTINQIEEIYDLISEIQLTWHLIEALSLNSSGFASFLFISWLKVRSVHFHFFQFLFFLHFSSDKYQAGH